MHLTIQHSKNRSTLFTPPQKMSFQPLSVEQLHTMTADAGYDTPARKKGPPLTPRSSEACSAMGILPSELMPKPLAAFDKKVLHKGCNKEGGNITKIDVKIL